jgi:hypothetical protein
MEEARRGLVKYETITVEAALAEEQLAAAQQQQQQH